MNYLSVCSGIEAASVAWHPLGWTPLAFSEIEAFPRAVLAHHYPGVPCHGDFTLLRDQPWIVDADVLVGGTPCQAFSVAGLRLSLSDDRGNLSLEFIRLANAIDDLRSAAGRTPCAVLWENVPGVLSTRDNAFGHFLAGLAGAADPLDPPGRRWNDAGVVAGPKRTVAWRILDAQYFGLAQRRRRVFVVASAGGLDPVEVLFEREGVRRDTAPRRGEGERVAALTSSGVGTCGADDNQAQAGHLIASTGDLAHCLNAGGMGRQDYETETLVTHANGGGQLAVAFHENQRGELTLNPTAGSLKTGGGKPGQGYPAVAVAFDLRGREGGAQFEGPHDTANIRAASGGSSRSYVAGMAVRRLTPRECERLQGFPDDYTAVPYRGKPAADGPRYKALGNSMAVPVMRWIGRRIANHSQIMKETA